MPRPRVRIEDRQRAIKACKPCKTAKKRCDSRVPCSNCVKRGCEISCLHENSPVSAGRLSKAKQHRELETVAATDVTPCRPQSQVATGGQFVEPGSGISSTLIHLNPPIIVVPARDIVASHPIEVHSSGGPTCNMSLNTEQAFHPAVEADSFPRSRLMLNSSGEKVYIGKTASLAFLRFLRQILSQHMGPSQFTENRRGNVMLEAHANNRDLPDFEDSFEDKRGLIDCYFLAASGLLDLFTRSEIYKLLDETDGGGQSEFVSIGILDIVLAIGRQCRASDSGTSCNAERYFVRGQRAALAGMLEDPSIAMIWSFLLMAFYLLGACRRNAAFMYLGIAARAAHALGLHESDQYLVLSDQEQGTRLRTWKSLRILDVITSSILARPLASVSTRPDVTRVDNIPRNLTFSSSTASNFDLCTIIESVLRNISQKPLDTEAAQDLLKKLSQWSTNLLSGTRLCSFGATMRWDEHEKALGNVHVACMYYFTVMLLTRPFLIRYLMVHISNKQSNESALPSDLSKLAQVSIDAAMFTAQICHNALSTGLLLDNMCILKAWIFAAGLVLGFTLFANVDVDFDTETAFTGVRDVLKKLSHRSPQAEHYHDVLSSFQEAISRRRQQLSKERRRVTSQYLDQIFVIDVQGSQERQDMTQNLPDTEAMGLETDSIEDWWNSSLPFAPGILENPPDILTADWDAFAVQISEQLTNNSHIT